MSPEKIIELAKQAGCFEKHQVFYFTSPELKAFAKLVAKHEREACAKFIENCSLPDSYSEPCLVEFAKDIRAGEHT